MGARVLLLVGALGLGGLALAEPEARVLAAETVPLTRSWDGLVEAVDQATLSAQTSGRIVELPFDVDDLVEQGQVVVRFTDTEQQAALRRAQSALDAAQAAATQAAADHARISELHQRNLVARAELDAAQARLDAAQANLRGARSALEAAREQLEYTVVRAPYTGIVTARHVQVGEAVNPGQPLISGLTLDALRVQVDIPQSAVAAVRASAQATVLLPDGRRVAAERVTVFPYADPATHSFRVRVELPEADTGLYPGMRVKVEFVLGSERRLAVESSALLRRGGLEQVYVDAGDGRWLLRPVRSGARLDDGRVLILSGLRDGERYLVDARHGLALRAQTEGQR